jgi:hypothetical protein
VQPESTSFQTSAWHITKPGTPQATAKTSKTAAAKPGCCRGT